MKRLLISGTNSGCGKTTITCAVLKALSGRGLRVSAFKCGPDYIDPMFHKRVIGVDSHNLDSFFCDDNTLCFLLNEYSAEISIIEGVMGYYDGVNGRGSAHSVSLITNTPSVLVVNCRGMSDSLGAVVSGFLNYRENNIKGVIFNGLPERLEDLARSVCCELGMEYLGRFPKCGFSLDSRHLGLVTPAEMTDIREKLSRLGELAERHLDIDKLVEISESGELSFNVPELPRSILPASRTKARSLTRYSRNISGDSPPVIAVSEDNAFCFRYAENLDLLRKLGCRIKKFSPLEDSAVPECDGLILCGGYPELYAKQLFSNADMLRSVRKTIGSGVPTIAECGGFMYLHERFTDNSGAEYTGVGIIKGRVRKTDKLQRFGYVELTSERGNLLCREGEKIRAHEFHYWDSDNAGSDLIAKKADGREWECAHCTENLYAGFPHLYFYSDIGIAERFVQKAAEFRGKL